MSKVDKIKIFLASPSDVKTERRHVQKVIEEINRTITSAQGVVLEIICSENAFPGYGKDGQAILNDQIGDMQEYELFIGIMWNRLGTPTPRARSGTVEEFERAVKTLKDKGKPHICFYFRQVSSNFKTQEEIRQKQEVLKFKNKFIGMGLFKEYTTPANFRDKLREDLNKWLNHYKSKIQPFQLPSIGVNERKKTPKIKLSSVSSNVINNSTKVKSVTSRKNLNSKKILNNRTGTIQEPRNWVMLNNKFFQANSTSTQPDRSIILRLTTKNMEQIAELKALAPTKLHYKQPITYADQHEAGIMQVSSLTTELVAGKTCFSFTLTPNQQSHNNSFITEMNFNNYNADEIAELRIRLLLLGESLPEQLRHYNAIIPNNPFVNFKNGLFSDLWTTLQVQSRSFLPKAWLWAVYHLKMSQLIEDVLELQLGPISKKVMPIIFRGRRRQSYVNQEPKIIRITGNCTLNM